MGAKKLRNVFLLILSQAFFLSSSMSNVSFAGLAGKMLSPDPGYATLPLSLVIISTAIAAGPFSMLMQKTSRKRGFVMGSLSGVVSGLVAAYALYIGSFGLFCLASLLLGPYFASAQFYRFAAAESVPRTKIPRAISFVLLGGIFAALMVPTANAWFNDQFMPYTFVGIYVFIAVMALLSVLPLAFLQATGPSPGGELAQKADSPARPFSEIIRDGKFIVAVTNGIAGYAMMSFVMTATPLAMDACGFGTLTSSHVIQGHVIAMFLPSLITGHLINRFGVMKILLAGQAAFAMAFATALSGIEVAQFSLALILLGVGWNFCFVGGSTLLTAVHSEVEKGKVQGLNEMLVFGVSALGSLASGMILNTYGWDMVNKVTFVILAGAMLITVGYVLRTRRSVPESP